MALYFFHYPLKVIVLNLDRNNLLSFPINNN